MEKQRHSPRRLGPISNDVDMKARVTRWCWGRVGQAWGKQRDAGQRSGDLPSKACVWGGQPTLSSGCYPAEGLPQGDLISDLSKDVSNPDLVQIFSVLLLITNIFFLKKKTAQAQWSGCSGACPCPALPRCTHGAQLAPPASCTPPLRPGTSPSQPCLFSFLTSVF